MKTQREKMKVTLHPEGAALRRQGFAEEPLPHEDGMRTSGAENTYEWWYADAALEDGSTVVVVFYTKLLPDFAKGMSPMVQVTYTSPEGKQDDRYYSFGAEEFSAPRGHGCDVRIGKNYFRGDLEDYEIHVEDEADRLCLDLSIRRITESWRPGWDGLTVYGSEDAQLGWFIAVPQGTVEAEIELGGKKKSLKGSAYHDHNWGNVGLPLLFNHWYWARTEIGPYAVICSQIVCSKAFGSVESGSFVLAKDGKIVTSRTAAADESWMLRSTPHVQPVTGKLLSNVLRFYHQDGEVRYELTLTRDHNILDSDLTPEALRGQAHKEGRDVGYHRMTGAAELKVFDRGNLVETQRNDIAVWEMMSFGAPE